MKDYYKILDVSYNADEVQIKKAYKRLALQYHPDLNSSRDASDKFIQINEAYETLGDSAKRAQYDFAFKAFLSANRPPPKRARTIVYDSNIPYRPGVKGTIFDPYAGNNVKQVKSTPLLRILLWIAFATMLLRACTNQ